MGNITIAAGDLKVPRDARRAVERGEVVSVTNRGSVAYVLLSVGDYQVVSPILERRRRGLPVPVEKLLTAEDLEIIALDNDEDVVADGIVESWNDE